MKRDWKSRGRFKPGLCLANRRKSRVQHCLSTRPQNSVAGRLLRRVLSQSGRIAKRLMVVIADGRWQERSCGAAPCHSASQPATIAPENAHLRIWCEAECYACAHSLNGMRFTTAVSRGIQPASRRLTYVNAGHNAPILRRANGAVEPWRSAACRSAFAWTALTKLPPRTQPGDALIFSPMASSRLHESGEDSGNERWLNAIRSLPDWECLATLQFLMSRVAEFVGATRQSDDINLSGLRSRRPSRNYPIHRPPSRPRLSHNHSVMPREMANSEFVIAPPQRLSGAAGRRMRARPCCLPRTADYDVTTDATPEQVMALFPEASPSAHSSA